MTELAVEHAEQQEKPASPQEGAPEDTGEGEGGEESEAKNLTINTGAVEHNEAPGTNTQRTDESELSDETPRTFAPQISDCVVSKYEGERNAADLFDGHARSEFYNHANYEGQFKNGLMHGRGRYVWQDGTVYEGDFLEGKITGVGHYSWTDGNVYEGEVLNGVRHGQGSFWLASRNAKYEGQWVHGKRHGKGTLYFDEEGAEVYVGDWEQDRRQGFGKLTYASGNYYEGYWKNNLRDGKGTMRWLARMETYVGMWKAGFQEGHGVHTWYIADPASTGSSLWQQQNSYDGEWSNGKRNGLGSFFYADGSRYEGSWKDNLKHGSGVFHFANGSKYTGPFIEDRLVNYKPHDTPAIGAMDLPLYIDDLLELDDDASQQLTVIRNLLLNYNTELKSIFKHYCTYSRTQLPVFTSRAPMPQSFISSAPKGTTAPSPRTPSGSGAPSPFPRRPSLDLVPPTDDTSYAMSMLQFWKFAKDCQLPDHVLTLATIDRIFLRINRERDSRRQLLSEIHNPDRSLVYREFVEGIIRMGDAKFEHCSKVSERVSCVLLDHVIPHAMSRGPSDALRSALVSNDAKNVVKRYTQALSELFQQYAKSSNADGTVNLRDILNLAKKHNLLGHSVTRSRVIEIFLRMSRDDETFIEENATNLEIELIFPEFVEGLCRVAILSSQQPPEVPSQPAESGEPDASVAEEAAALTNTDAAAPPTLPASTEAHSTTGSSALLVVDEAELPLQLDAFFKKLFHPPAPPPPEAEAVAGGPARESSVVEAQ